MQLSKEKEEELLERISLQLSKYTIGLIRYRQNESHADLLGSGLLVNFDDKYKGVLTAGHVGDLVKGEIDLGFVLSQNDHNCSLKVKNINLSILYRKNNIDFGPDIAFLKISDIDCQKFLKPIMSFYPINRKSFEDEDRINNSNVSTWFISGFPGERVKTATSNSFDVFYDLHGLCGAVKYNRYLTKDKYSYIEIEVDYLNNVSPESFGGMSGGGIWKIPLKFRENEFIICDYILTGVIFYQSEVMKNRRRIRGHSIKDVFNFLDK